MSRREGDSGDWPALQPIPNSKESKRPDSKRIKLAPSCWYRGRGEGFLSRPGWIQPHTKGFAYLHEWNITESSADSIGKNSDDGGAESINDLTHQKDIGSCWCFYNSVEVEDEIVQPAGVGDIVEEMAHSIGPEMFVLQFVELSLSLLNWRHFECRLIYLFMILSAYLYEECKKG